MRLAVVIAIVATASPACAQLPAPGSTYHLLFATRRLFSTNASQVVPPAGGRFGNIAGAEWQVTNAAADANAPGMREWNGVTRVYQTLLSVSGDNAVDRVSVSGPVFNFHGELLANDHADLFDGSLYAAVGYDEYGNAIESNVYAWTGATPIGQSAGSSCGTWNSTSSMVTGRVGEVAAEGGVWLGSAVNRTCNLSARLYGLSPALTAPLWGDYDGSGPVDGGDFLEWQRYVGKGQAGMGPLLPAAFDNSRSFLDGNAAQPVGMTDLAIIEQYFGQSLPPAVSVPEPGTLVAAATGLLAVLQRRRTRCSTIRRRSAYR